MELYAWKFIIPPEKWTKLQDSNNEVSGCLAIAVAETEDEARQSLERFAAENGHDPRWLRVARVNRLALTAGAPLAWVLQ